jgi:hypothetical protein
LICGGSHLAATGVAPTQTFPVLIGRRLRGDRRFGPLHTVFYSGRPEELRSRPELERDAAFVLVLIPRNMYGIPLPHHFTLALARLRGQRLTLEDLGARARLDRRPAPEAAAGGRGLGPAAPGPAGPTLAVPGKAEPAPAAPRRAVPTPAAPTPAAPSPAAPNLAAPHRWRAARLPRPRRAVRWLGGLVLTAACLPALPFLGVRYARQLDRLLAQVRPLGCRAVVLTTPIPLPGTEYPGASWYQAALARELRRGRGPDVAVADAYRRLRRLRGRGWTLPGDALHLSPEGHRELADELVAALNRVAAPS